MMARNSPKVMGDDNNTSAESVDSICQTVDGRNIETVGRLVQQQHVGLLDGQEGEDDTTFLTIGEGADQRSLGIAAQAILAELLSPVLVIL